MAMKLARDWIFMVLFGVGVREKKKGKKGGADWIDAGWNCEHKELPCSGLLRSEALSWIDNRAGHGKHRSRLASVMLDATIPLRRLGVITMPWPY
jgi:hypothetical protein